MLIQAHMTLKTAEGTDRAWHLVKLMEADYGEKMVVPLLKIELLSASEHIDENEYYNGKLLTDYMTWTNQGSAESNDLDHRTQ
ncbi:sporulation-specific protein 22 [Nothophoma quercina]|uniref:Sporulation-specific protein 22 n=1 Tax=Nothophoma quercina TaxID=749835 RepID=A0ABR3R9H0_9PLEO